MTTIEELDQLCRDRWGAVVRDEWQLSGGDLPRLQDIVQFDVLSAELKVHVADKLIRESLSRCGAMVCNGDIPWFIARCGAELPFRRGIFDDRRMEVVQAAFAILASALPFSSTMVGDDWKSAIFSRGGIGLTGNYLLAQLEYTFRRKCPYLDEDGIISGTPPPRFNLGDRINRVDVAFELYLNGSQDDFVRRVRELDRTASVKDRLRRLRNPAAHGTLGSLCSEAHFYAMLLAMFFYNEPAN